MPFEVLENPICVENSAIFPVPHKDVRFPGLRQKEKNTSFDLIECSGSKGKEIHVGTELQAEMFRLQQERLGFSNLIFKKVFFYIYAQDFGIFEKLEPRTFNSCVLFTTFIIMPIWSELFFTLRVHACAKPVGMQNSDSFRCPAVFN